MPRFPAGLTLLFTAFVAFVTGCGSKSESPNATNKPGTAENSSSSNSATGPKFATPEECFAQFVKSNAKLDEIGITLCQTESARNMLCGNFAVQLEKVAKESKHPSSKTAGELLEQNGLLNRNLKGYVDLVAKGNREDRKLAQMQIGANVKDQEKFLRAAGAIVIPPPPQGSPTGPSPEFVEKASQLQLTDLKVEGDKAEGTMEGQPISFLKQGGSWYMSTSKEEPDWRSPIQGKYRFEEYKG